MDTVAKVSQSLSLLGTRKSTVVCVCMSNQSTVPVEALGCESHFTLVALKYVIYCPNKVFVV